MVSSDAVAEDAQEQRRCEVSVLRCAARGNCNGGVDHCGRARLWRCGHWSDASPPSLCPSLHCAPLLRPTRARSPPPHRGPCNDAALHCPAAVAGRRLTAAIKPRGRGVAVTAGRLAPSDSAGCCDRSWTGEWSKSGSSGAGRACTVIGRAQLDRLQPGPRGGAPLETSSGTNAAHFEPAALAGALDHSGTRGCANMSSWSGV